MELPPTTRYVSRGNKSFAYQAFGRGEKALVCFLELSTHLDLLWADPYFADGLARLGQAARVVIFQQMGFGLSDAIDHVPTLEEQTADVLAVMDAEDISVATLFGVYSTTLPLVLLAAREPERVEAMVLMVPYPQGYRNDEFDRIAGLTPTEAESLARMEAETLARWGEGLTIDIFYPALAERTRRAWGMLERNAATPLSARAVYEAASHADVRAVLPLVQAPTRVLHQVGATVPEGAPRVVAQLIPNATFHRLAPPEPYMTPGETFPPVVDHLLEVVGADHPSAVDRQLGSILFTDVVSSTEHVSALGDARWGDILRRHEQQLRRRIASEDGELIKMMGDGSASVFDGPAAGIRAARALTADARELGIEIRAGIHTGECDRRPDGDISGLAVHVAARVAAAAQPGEVWVSRTVRDLIGGSGLQLASRGSHALKGLPEEWELFCVLGEDEHARAVPSEPSQARVSDRLALAAARRTPRLARAINRIATNASSRKVGNSS